MKYNFYPILIDGVPHNVVVRSQRILFDAADTYRAIPNTIAISFENQGAQSVVLDGVFTIAPGSAPYNLGGDPFVRRDDEIAITFTGAGATLCIVTQDLVLKIVPLEII